MSCFASALPAAACPVTACRPWQMGFSHVCHLFRASSLLLWLPAQATPAEQAAARGGKSRQERGGMQLPQEPQKHYIQNTLNAALRLNAAELVLSFTERKPATAGLLTTFNCSSLPFGPRTAVQGSPKAEQHVAPCLF